MGFSMDGVQFLNISGSRTCNSDVNNNFGSKKMQIGRREIYFSLKYFKEIINKMKLQ